MAKTSPQTPRKKRALVLGGGAPNATFMSGALIALMEKQIDFDIVAASGAGAVVAMLYLAPKNGDPALALKNTINEGVADSLYGVFPINYKVFQKRGPMADLFRSMTGALFGPILAPMNAASNPAERLMADAIQFGLAAATPWPLDSAISTGLCEILPGFDALVDFSKLTPDAGAQNGLPDLVINAFNVEKREVEYFHSRTGGGITLDHARAALAFPFLYPPHELNGVPYLEGASFDDVPYEALMNQHEGLEEIYLIDVLGTNSLIRTPRSLMEAFTLMIVASITAAAKLQVKLFIDQHRHHHEVARDGKRHQAYSATADDSGRDFTYLQTPVPDLYLISADQADAMPDALTWERSNLEAMFHAGHKAAPKAKKIVHP